MIEFVCASNNDLVLNKNLLRSAFIGDYFVTIKKEFDNIPKAYNSAQIIESFVIYCHNDVYLPKTFEEDVMYSINLMNVVNSDWGVIGVCGVKLINGKKENFGNILDRGKSWAYNIDKLPAEVDTLDECLIITRGNLKFDENLPLDFYGADICLQARKQGRKCYAINAYLEHNSSRPMGGRTESFYKSQEYFMEKWKEYLPVATTCAMIE